VDTFLQTKGLDTRQTVRYSVCKQRIERLDDEGNLFHSIQDEAQARTRVELSYPEPGSVCTEF